MNKTLPLTARNLTFQCIKTTAEKTKAVKEKG